MEQQKGKQQEQTEAIAVLEDVEWGISKGIQKLHLETDNKNVSDAINGSTKSVKWTTSNVIQDFLSRLELIKEWKCESVKRDANACADTLVKHVRKELVNLEWSSPPVFLQNDLEREKQSVMIYRGLVLE